MVLPIRISSSAALELEAAPSTRAMVIKASLRISTTVRIISPCYATLLLRPDLSEGPIAADAAWPLPIPARRLAHTKRGPLQDQAARRQPSGLQAPRRRTCLPR